MFKLITNNVFKLLSKVHPKQIINIGVQISVFKITYSYLTPRNNRKTGEKYLLTNYVNPQKDLTEDFNKWVEIHNKNNIHKQISNVKILDIECIGFINN